MWIAISLSLIINLFFNKNLKNRYHEKRFLEMGYQLNLFLSIYIIGPALVLITSSYVEGDPISYLYNGFTYANEQNFIFHLYRMLAFQLTFAIFYLFFRNFNNISLDIKKFSFSKFMVIFFGLILLLTYIILFTNSNTFENYVESYQRFDHLSPVLKLIVSILVRFKFAFIIIFLINLFYTFKNNKFLLFLTCSILIYLEFIFSAGARISLFFLFLQLFILISIFFGVPFMSFKKLFLGIIAFATLFVFIERLRINDTGFESETLLSIPGEFGSVFFTSFHLYNERISGSLPETNSMMLFFDFFGAILPNSKIIEYDPIFWYQKNYFPETDVPPFTLGPISNTAIWEGYIGLFLRSFLCALLIAKVSNYFSSGSFSFFKLLLYMFLFSTCIMIHKYSIFYHITPFVKNIIIPFIFYSALIFLLRPYTIKYNIAD
tara:strand:- start:955 stop:2256 length:1302 start_codon:yes stop_codon:yes gene_type:complete